MQLLIADKNTYALTISWWNIFEQQKAQEKARQILISFPLSFSFVI